MQNIMKLIALLLCVCLLGTFTACGTEDPVPSQTQQTEAGTVPTVPTVEETVPETTVPETTEPLPTEPEPTQPTEPEPEITQITMTFVGDCTFGCNQKHTYPNSFNEAYDKYGPDYFLDDVRHIFEADDITVINLEGSLTTSTDIVDKTWNHKGDPEYVQIMTGSSVEVAGMGNNHRLDYSQSGFEETVQVLEDADIGYCYNDKFLVYEVKGIKVGFASVNALYEWEGKKFLKEGCKYLREEQGCDLVVACVHWGDDKVHQPNGFQLGLGPALIDMGYDLVVGHHPHVLQGIQLYKGKYICYSLGNFCYGGSKNPADKDSGIFQQTFTFVDGELVSDANGQFIPCTLSSVSNRNDYQPTLVEGEEFQRIIDKMNQYSAQFGLKLGPDGRPILEELP